MLESRGGVAGQEAKPEGAADSNPRGRGKIVNVASLVSYQGGLTVPAYAAAKVHGLLLSGIRRPIYMSNSTVYSVSRRHCPMNGSLRV